MNIVALYLAAIVAANLIVAALGPGVSVLTAFVFIGLNITARDRLHDAWRGHGLKWKMAVLITVGGALSWALNTTAAPIAVASSVAFAGSESVDALLYHLLRKRPWYERVNGSNAVSAAVDSVLFPALAFGAFLPAIVAGQFVAKVFGGSLWAWALRPRHGGFICQCDSGRLGNCTVHDPEMRKAAGLAPLMLALVAAPASGQVMSVGVGEYHNEFVTQEVVEAVVLFPGAVTPNLIVSWDLHGDGKPVLLPQVGRDIVTAFPVIAGFDVGASAGPWDDYAHWEPHVSVRAIAFLVGPLKAITIMSWQPWNEWARAVVAKVDWTF